MNAEELLKEALELIWYMQNAYHKQKEAVEFMKKCEYNFYEKDKWEIKKR